MSDFATAMDRASPSIYWPMDDGSGTALRDVRSGHFRAVTYGSPSLSGAGIVAGLDTCLTMVRALSQHARMDEVAPFIASSDELTIETYFLTSDTTQVSDWENSLYSTNNVDAVGMRPAVTADGRLYMRVDDATTYHGSGLNDGIIHQAAFRWPDGGAGVVVIDGVESGAIIEYPTTINRFSISNEWDSAGPSDFFQGKLAAFSIHRREVPTSELLQRFRIAADVTGAPYISGTVDESGAAVSVFNSAGILVASGISGGGGAYQIQSWLLDPADGHLVTCELNGYRPLAHGPVMPATV